MTESEISPQRRSWIWLSRDVTNTSGVHPGDLVGFEAFGRRVVGTVTRLDADGITIREERW